MGLSLFEPCQINGMQLKNRFVRSATWEGMATETGACTDRLIHLMVNLARGGVGLLITSHAYVRPDGQAGPWQLGIYQDDLVEGLARMTHAVHEAGGKVVLQIAHAGMFASAKIIGTSPLAFSEVEGYGRAPRKVLTLEDFTALTRAFAEAAKRAVRAGFDGVQIHAAHGYLLSQSLSPAWNKRTDAYGGSVENRARLLLEVTVAIRKAVGKAFPLLIKMNGQDFVEGGLTLEDSLQIARMVEDAGVDAIELSGGTLVSGKDSPSRAGITSEEREAYFQGEARAFKENVGIPVILVGGNRSLGVAERLVKEGLADFISMSRPLIREPDLIGRWAAGDVRPATCLSDNLCFGPGMAGEGIYCVVEKKQEGKKAG